MKIQKLETLKELENLKKGDCILVGWSENFTDHMKDAKKIMLYYIVQNKKECEEIICKMPTNHYFNYKLYLQGRSVAEEVYKINY